MRLPPRFPHCKFIGSRHDFLLQIADGKLVLHVGCGQYSEEPDRNFHLRLYRVANELYGLDIDKEAINNLKKQGIPNLYVGDASRAHEIFENIQFETILLPEVLEHTGNPMGILLSLKKLLSDNGEFVISGPNSFSLRRFLWAFLGREAESPDHRFTFHPSGFCALVNDAGLRIINIYTAIESSHRPTTRHKIANKLLTPLLRFKPYMADSIIVICKKCL